MSSQLFNSKPLHISKVGLFGVSIANWFETVGLEQENWSFIGSLGKKEFSGDVDIAVLSGYNDDLNDWAEIFEQLELDYKIFKGFNQISFGYPFEGQIVQVDLMLTQDLDWSKFIYYSPNLSSGESKYGGIYRNLLLSSLIISESRFETTDGNIEQFILRLDRGLFWVTKSFKDVDGKIRKTSNIIKESYITQNVDSLCSYFQLKNPIMTFEQLWDQVKVRSSVERTKKRFEKFCYQSKIEIPDYD